MSGRAGSVSQQHCTALHVLTVNDCEQQLAAAAAASCCAVCVCVAADESDDQHSKLILGLSVS